MTLFLNPRQLLVSATVFVLVFVGAAVSVYPIAALFVGGLVVVALIASLGQRLPHLFLLCLAIALTGYAFLGRGFAYFGFSFVFVGEILLGLALLVTLTRIRELKFTVLHGLIALYMLWGFTRTIPYLEIYGIDALRDAVIWVYAVFAFAISFLIRRNHFISLVTWYGRLLPYFVVWTPIALVLAVTHGYFVTLPGSGVPLLTARPGEWAVHLAGGAAFILLGLWTRYPERRLWSEVLLWTSWVGAVALTVAMNRASLLAITVASCFAVILRPARHVATAAWAAIFLITVVVFVDPEIELGYYHREFTVAQFTQNIQSIVFDTGEQDLDGTREWRVNWWEHIIDETLYGPYRWTGKGFGLNLAVDFGYVERSAAGWGDDDVPRLRSPHNGHLTILARMGIPGLGLWILLQTVFAASLANTTFRAWRNQDLFWFQLCAWLLTYWVALMVNMSFEVFLEGPQGGIWFWTIIGLGIAVQRIYHETRSTESQNQDRWPQVAEI